MYDDLLGKRKIEDIPEKKHYNLVKDELSDEEVDEAVKQAYENWTEGDPGYLEPSQDIAQ